MAMHTLINTHWSSSPSHNHRDWSECEAKYALFSVFLQESLRKITHTLALKNEEISNFVCTLKQSLENLEVRPKRIWHRCVL